MKYSIAITIVLTSLAACTTTDEIIIDKKGVDLAKYQQDLAECRSYSSEVRTTEKAAKGTASGAVVGGLIAAAAGEDVESGAGVGAVTGGAKGVNQGEKTKVQVVKRCLSGRGYRVLN